MGGRIFPGGCLIVLAATAGVCADGVCADGVRADGVRADGARVPELNLRTGLTLSATTVSVGQRFEVVLEVENIGAVECGELRLEDLVWSGPGRVVSLKEPARPAAGRLPPGAARNFVWEYSAAGRGAVRFTAKLNATDAITGRMRALRPRLRGPLRIQDPPRLAVAVSAEPEDMCSGQEFRVILNLTNLGEAAARDVMPGGFSVSGTGSIAVRGDLRAIEPKNLAGGESYSWSRTYYAGAAGALILSGTASGMDANSGEPIMAGPGFSLPLTVRDPGTLAVSASTRRRTSVGQWGAAFLTVTNTGGSPVTGLSLGLEIASGEAQLLAHPASAAGEVLAPGAARTLCWTYSISGKGKIALRGKATGFTCGETPLSSTCVSVITAQQPAVLLASLAVSTSQVVVGQPVRVALTVTDGGEAAARGVRPELMECSGPAVRISPHPFGFRSLESGEGTSYHWTYSPSGAGEAFWTVRARGIDGNSGVPIMTEWLKTPPVSIFAPAELSIKSLRLLPGGTVEQEAFVQAFLVIGNDGQADAEIGKLNIKELVPQAFKKKNSKAKPTLTGWFAPNTDFPLLVAGGKAAVIMWTYRAIDAGPTYVTVSAEGRELLTGRKMSLAETPSNEVVVEEPPKPEEGEK